MNASPCLLPTPVGCVPYFGVAAVGGAAFRRGVDFLPCCFPFSGVGPTTADDRQIDSIPCTFQKNMDNGSCGGTDFLMLVLVSWWRFSQLSGWEHTGEGSRVTEAA